MESKIEKLPPLQIEIDELWVAEPEKRVTELESGKVEAISGEDIFSEIRHSVGRPMTRF